MYFLFIFCFVYITVSFIVVVHHLRIYLNSVLQVLRGFERDSKHRLPSLACAELEVRASELLSRRF